MKFPQLPFQRHSDTSREAAESMTEVAPNLRERVYRAIKSSPAGLTAEEACTLTGIKGDTLRPRIVELVGQNRIRVAGKRPTKSGRKADVWVAL